MQILIDVDGVLADFASTYLDAYEEINGDRPDPEDVTAWDFSNLEGNCDDVWELIRQEGVCLEISPYPGAEDLLKVLRAEHTVIAVTSPLAGAPHWMHERWEWLRGLGFDKDEIIFTHAKYQVWGDVLIDDKPDHVRAFAGSASWLFDQPYNRDADDLDRVEDYAEILARLASPTKRR